MGLIIFYDYLKHKKDNKEPLKNVMTKLPLLAKVQIVLFALTYVALGVIALNPFKINNIAMFIWIPYLLIAIEIFAFNYYFDNFQIKNIKNSKEKSIENYKELYTWLKGNYGFKEKEQIEELKSRIENHIENIDKQINKTQDKIDKWFQVLLIPLLLSSFGVYATRQTNQNDVLQFIIVALLLFILIYILAILITYLIFYFKSRNINRMRTFTEDLQGIIDIKFLNFGVKSKEKLHVKYNGKA